MPLYTAQCTVCEETQDYQASAHDYCPKCDEVFTSFKKECPTCKVELRSFRDEQRRSLSCCGELELVPIIYAPRSIQCPNFENIQQSKMRPKGTYSLGVDEKGNWRRPVSTKRDIQKLHDDYNRAWEGERHAKAVFSEDAA